MQINSQTTEQEYAAIDAAVYRMELRHAASEDIILRRGEIRTAIAIAFGVMSDDSYSEVNRRKARFYFLFLTSLVGN